MLNRDICSVLKNFEEYKKTGDKRILVGLSDELWYDWFCSDSALVNKTKVLLTKLKSIVKDNEKGKRFDPEKCYVFFKNNCPVCGNLYDDFRICSIETGEVIYTITPKLGYNGADWGKSEVYDVDARKAIVLGAWKDAKNFFRGE